MTNLSDDKIRYKKSQKIIWITIILNVILAVGKIVVGIIANSSAILADGIHTVSDIGSSIGLIVGLFIASKPQDTEHHYGHEKAESVATFVLSLLLLTAGINIGISAIKLIISGDIATPGVSAIYAGVASIIVKEIQFRISLKAGKKYNNKVLIADAWHHRSDALSSLAALLGIIGARLGYKFLDPVAGFVVSIIIIKAGIEIFIDALNELMDVSIEKEKIINLTKKIMLHKQVKTINDIKARKHGSKVFIDIQIAVDPDITVFQGHKIAEDVEKIVFENVENVKDVLVHVNPCWRDGDKSCGGCGNPISEFLINKDDK